MLHCLLRSSQRPVTSLSGTAAPLVCTKSCITGRASRPFRCRCRPQAVFCKIGFIFTSRNRCRLSITRFFADAQNDTVLIMRSEHSEIKHRSTTTPIHSDSSLTLRMTPFPSCGTSTASRSIVRTFPFPRSASQTAPLFLVNPNQSCYTERKLALERLLFQKWTKNLR